MEYIYNFISANLIDEDHSFAIFIYCRRLLYIYVSRHRIVAFRKDENIPKQLSLYQKILTFCKRCMMEQEIKLLAFITYTHSGIWFLSLIVFLLLLYRLYRKHKESWYLWLMMGIVIIPLISFVCSIALPFFAMRLIAEYTNSVEYAQVISTVVDCVFHTAKFVCIFVALSKISNDVVPFSLLFSIFRR